MLVCKWSPWFILILLIQGCLASVRPVNTESISKPSQSYWAKQTFYAGLFFDDDRYGFLSPIPFNQLTCLRSPTGDYIVPAQSSDLIYFGTRVQIQKIEWPTPQNRIKRPLLTPGHLGWIYLTVAMDRGSSVSVNRDKTYIMLIPESIHTQDELMKWFGNYFDTQDNNLWFLTQPKEKREAILTPPK